MTRLRRHERARVGILGGEVDAPRAHPRGGVKIAAVLSPVLYPERYRRSHLTRRNRYGWFTLSPVHPVVEAKRSAWLARASPRRAAAWLAEHQLDG